VVERADFIVERNADTTAGGPDIADAGVGFDAHTRKARLEPTGCAGAQAADAEPASCRGGQHAHERRQFIEPADRKRPNARRS
jgi:hypothetical protein